MSNAVYEVYAIRYGHHDRPSSENFILGDAHDVLEPLDYYVWVIIGEHGTFLVDTGFSEDVGTRRNRVVTKSILDGLRALSVDPDQILDIIVTHMHYDHIGNYDLFPRARYHLQDSEMAYATGRCMCYPLIRIPFEEDDVVAMVRKVFSGRVMFHDGDAEIAPGITVHHIGGHSKGLQCVKVRTRRGDVVLASDTAHLYAHLFEGRVFPLTYNIGDVYKGYETLRRLAPTDEHIIPGHDPLVLERYPVVRSGLEGWIVRLDVEPKL